MLRDGAVCIWLAGFATDYFIWPLLDVSESWNGERALQGACSARVSLCTFQIWINVKVGLNSG